MAFWIMDISDDCFLHSFDWIEVVVESLGCVVFLVWEIVDSFSTSKYEHPKRIHFMSVKEGIKTFFCQSIYGFIKSFRFSYFPTGYKFGKEGIQARNDSNR